MISLDQSEPLFYAEFGVIDILEISKWHSWDNNGLSLNAC